MRARTVTGSRRGARAARLAVMALAVAGLPFAAPAVPAAAALPNPYPTGPGYWMAASDGGIFAFGDSQFFGSIGGTPLNQPVVGFASHPYYEGYWEVATDGGIFAFGSAGFYGSTGGSPLIRPIVGMAAHPSGQGYWLVASDGGIFAFGAARFHGSLGGLALNQPIVGMETTPSGNGYWLVASDGGLFGFGDATFHGSLGGLPLVSPVVGMEARPGGGGYWMVAADGGIFAFNAPFFGSIGGTPLARPVVGMTKTATGGGYAMVAGDGGVFAFGNQGFFGSLGGLPLVRPVIGIDARPPLSIGVDPFANDDGSIGRSSSWVSEPGDERLVLTHGVAGVAAGARVLGAESLNVSQLGTVGFSIEAGTTCSGQSPQMAIYADTNGDGAFDATNTITCTGVGPQVISANPVTGGTRPLPAAAVVTGIDILYTANGTAKLDDIRAAGITVTDHRTFTAAGTALGRSSRPTAAVASAGGLSR